MTKAELLKLLEPLPDDTPIVILWDATGEIQWDVTGYPSDEERDGEKVTCFVID